MPLCKDLLQNLKNNLLSSNNQNITYIIQNHIIGQGTTSIVKQAVHSKTNKTVAVKIINLFLYQNLFEQEIQALTHLHHENIIELIDYTMCTDKNSGSIFLEFLPHPSLFWYIQNNGRMSEEIAYVILEQIVSAFNYMHGKGFSHNDFKPENVSYNEENHQIKILDFGLSKTVTSPQSNIGSPLYMAPEVHLSPSFVPQYADIWSVGITLYEILTGDVPWSDCEDQHELLDKILFEDETNLIHYPSYLSKQSNTLLKKLLRKDPSHRIKIEDLEKTLKKWKMDLVHSTKNLKEGSTITTIDLIKTVGQ